MLRNGMLFIYFSNAIKCLLWWHSHHIIIIFIIPSVFSYRSSYQSPSNTQPDNRQAPNIRAERPEMPSIPLEESLQSFHLWKKCLDTVTVDTSIKLFSWQMLRRRKPVHSSEISVHGLSAIVPNIPCVSLWSYKRSTHNLTVVLCFQKLGHRLKYYPLLQ